MKTGLTYLSTLPPPSIHDHIGITGCQEKIPGIFSCPYAVANCNVLLGSYVGSNYARRHQHFQQ